MKFKKIIGFVSVLFISVVVCAEEELLNKAKKYENEKNLQLAGKYYLEAIKNNEKNVEAHAGLARCYSQSRMPAEALKEYHKVLELKPANTDALFGIGASYIEMKDYVKGVEYYKKGLEIEPINKFPGNIYLHHSVGICLVELGKYKEAKRYFDEALTIFPDFPDSYLGLGRIAKTEGKKEEALQHYKKALEIYQKYKAYEDIELVQKEIESLTRD